MFTKTFFPQPPNPLIPLLSSSQRELLLHERAARFRPSVDPCRSRDRHQPGRRSDRAGRCHRVVRLLRRAAGHRCGLGAAADPSRAARRSVLRTASRCLGRPGGSTEDGRANRRLPRARHDCRCRLRRVLGSARHSRDHIPTTSTTIIHEIRQLHHDRTCPGLLRHPRKSVDGIIRSNREVIPRANPTSSTQREFCRFSLFPATQVIELLNPCTPNSPNIACSADLPY